jgi:hypothetical protein
VLRYRRGVLIASLPSQLGELAGFLVTKDLVLTAGNDGSFVMLRGDAEQLQLVPRRCETQGNTIAGEAVGYRCDETWHLFAGIQPIASVPDRAMGYVAYDRPSGRAALGSKADELVIFEAGKELARGQRRHPGAFAFADREHLVIAADDRDAGVWRWTIGSETWERIATVPHATAIAATPTAVVVGTDTAVIALRGGAVASRTPIASPALYLTASRDGRWLAASLQNGATAILDGATGALVRQLEPSDATASGATFDAGGDLILRPGRGAMQVYDRASGDALIWNLDLLGESLSARFDDQGRIEVDTWEVGLLDIPIDRRPVAELLRDLDCKVPLRVVDARLGPAVPSCP